MAPKLSLMALPTPFYYYYYYYFILNLAAVFLLPLIWEIKTLWIHCFIGYLNPPNGKVCIIFVPLSFSFPFCSISCLFLACLDLVIFYPSSFTRSVHFLCLAGVKQWLGRRWMQRKSRLVPSWIHRKTRTRSCKQVGVSLSNLFQVYVSLALDIRGIRAFISSLSGIWFLGYLSFVHGL